MHHRQLGYELAEALAPNQPLEEGRSVVCEHCVGYRVCGVSRRANPELRIGKSVVSELLCFRQNLNLVSYGVAQLSLIDQPTQSIISSVALFSNIVFARRYFNEEIENKDVVALLMIILAIVLFVMYYQHSDQDITIEELQKHFTTTPFLATAFALLTIYAAAAAYNKCLKPENIRTNISGLAYGVVAAIIGGITVRCNIYIYIRNTKEKFNL